jgi:import inner membrane translocase subunit TIM44
MLSSVVLRTSSRRTAAQLLHRQASAAPITSRDFVFQHRTFATNPNKQEDEKQTEKDESKKEAGESLRDTINRMKGSSGGEADKKSSGNSAAYNDYLSKAADTWANLSEEVGKTWTELLASGNRKDINKKLLKHPEATKEGEKEYTGPADIMIIDPSENLSAWERMQKRLTDAPIIQDILLRSGDVYEKSGAKKYKERVDHLKEDAQEAWETSQNPWVYRLSSVYDTVTAETPESVAVRELHKLDPSFTLEDWRQDVVENSLPQIMQWFLEGKINQLKPWLGEGVFKRLSAEMVARKTEGVQIDTHVLGIMNSEILACEVSDRVRCCM